MAEGLVYFTVDIESRGDSAHSNGIVSIGVCISTDEVVLEKRRFDLAPLPGQVFEQRCLNEFWHRNDEMRQLLALLQANPMPPLEGIIAFRALLDRYANPVILSDNVGYDTAFINYYLELAGLPSLRYDATRTSYRPIFDTDSYARGATGMDYATSLWTSDSEVTKILGLSADRVPNKDELHDHMPENDAEYIWRMHMAVVKAAKRK